MNHADYKKVLGARLQNLNDTCREKYKLTYSAIYGGWRLSKRVGNTEVRGDFGNYLRYSSIEMLRYLQGVLDGLNYRRNNK